MKGKDAKKSSSSGSGSPAPPELPRQLVFVLALSAVSAITRPPPGAIWTGGPAWLEALLKILDLDKDGVPPDVDPSYVTAVARELNEWSSAEEFALAQTLVHASLATGSDEKNLAYTASERAMAHRTLTLLGLDAADLLPRAEAVVGETLMTALDHKNEKEVEEARDKQKHGWGGALGRGLATAGGVIAGGVLLGVTGGLAAPALAALLAGTGMGAILGASMAPIVIGTLFGLSGGGLAGWRVAERWRGVEEFEFIEVGAGTKPTPAEVADLLERQAEETHAAAQKEVLFELDDELEAEAKEAEAKQKLEQTIDDRAKQLSNLSIQAGLTEAAPESKPLPAKDASVQEVAASKPTRPSLTATIVVPGLLTVGRTEGLAAWRAVCSPHTTLLLDTQSTHSGTTGTTGTTMSESAAGLKDGRDVFLLQSETDQMLSTGRDLEAWVTSKLQTLAGTEIIKRTALGAYYAALALPVTVWKTTSLVLDNSWSSAQDRAVKAGRLLGEVLAQRVQGERPVTLIGTSVGALTVLHALLYLAEQAEKDELPSSPIVESAFFVGLPSAPSTNEWAKVRKAVTRRVVNAYSGHDFVLASIVRMHEVVSRGFTGQNGVRVAGLGPVEKKGIEDIDLSEVVQGHGEINAKAAEIVDLLRVDD